MNRSRRRRSKAADVQPSGGAATGLSLVVGVSTVLLLAGVYLWALGGTTPPGPAIGGHWSLTRDDGTRVTDRDFHGRYVLLYFGYTACPDVCPTTLNAVTDAMHLLGPRADRLQPLFVTVDPARDTASVVHDYVKRFGARLVGLTGTPADIARIEREYRIGSRATVTAGQHAGYAVDHTAVLLLLAPDGRYLAPFPADESAREIAEHLEPYLS